MGQRWGLGPVFASEWLTITRRWQVYAGRMLFVGLLLFGLFCVWLAQVAGRPVGSIQEQAATGQAFFAAIVNVEFILIFAVTPTALAGAICADKERGNLLPMLLTDLSNAEIVLGKLAGRLVPVVGMVICTLPVLATGSLLGGIDPLALAGALVLGITLAILVGSIALVFSTHGTRTYEVVLATMGVEAIWLLSGPIWWQLREVFNWSNPPRWVRDLNPFDLAFAPYGRPTEIDWFDYAAFCALALGIAAGLIGLSIWRVRSAAVAGSEGRRSSRAAAGRSDRMAQLDRDPVGWYERHRRQPTRWMHNMVGAYFGFAILFGGIAIYDGIWPRPGFAYGWFPSYVVGFAVAIGLPLILLTAATSTSDERTRGSLDVLLAAPVSTRRIVMAKWWASLRPVALLVPIPTLVVLPLAWNTGRWLEATLIPAAIILWGALAASLGLALATWIPRPTRAVTAAVVLYTLGSLGWPVTMIALTGGDGPWCWPLTAISPYYNAFFATENIAEARHYWFVVEWFCLAWVVVHAVMAGGLLLAVLATFDRALGRVRERSTQSCQNSDLSKYHSGS